MNSHDLTAHYLPLPPTLADRLVGGNYVLPEFEQQDAEYLKGFRAVVLTTHGPELPEFHVPVTYLRERGASVDVVTPDWLFNSKDLGLNAGLVVLAQWLAVKVCVKADKPISDAKVEDYHAVIILGGAWNPIMLRTEESVLQFIRSAHENGALIAAICHGPQVLINANIRPDGTRIFLEGTHITGVDDIRIDLKNAGFIVEDKPVVVDEVQRLITSPNPGTESIKQFCLEIGNYARQNLLRRV